MVIPQFLVTGLSSIIFAILDPDKSILHPGSTETPAGDGTLTSDAARGVLARGDDLDMAQKPNSIAIIFRYGFSFPTLLVPDPVSFRFGGIAAAIAFVLSYRLAKDLARR